MSEGDTFIVTGFDLTEISRLHSNMLLQMSTSISPYNFTILRTFSKNIPSPLLQISQS